MLHRQNRRCILLRACRSLRLRAVLVGVSACIWWAVLYPELCFTDGTYERVETEGADQADGAGSDDILRASGEEIVICSRLLEWIGKKTDRN